MFNSQWSSRLLASCHTICSLDAPVDSKRQRRPTRIQDPYGYSSLGLMQAANKEEFLKACDTLPETSYIHSLQDAPMILEIGVSPKPPPFRNARMSSYTLSMPCLEWRPLFNQRCGIAWIGVKIPCWFQSL